MWEWLQVHRGVVIAVAASMFVGLAAMAGALFVVVRLPADYLRKRQQGSEGRGGSWKRISRNILGWALIAAGVAMLVLPGPGLVVALMGVAMADFPGKHQMLGWLLSRSRILETMNRLRARFGKPPFEKPAGAARRAKLRKLKRGASMPRPVATSTPKVLWRNR